MHHSRELALFLSFVFGILLLPVKSDEIQDNKYTVTFKDVTTKTWTDDGKTEKFKNSMATVANDYCSNNYDKCSLKFWNSTRNFTSAHVKISSGYPKQVDGNLQVQFYVELPYGTDIRKNDTTILPVASLKVILSAKASTLSSLVGVEVMNNDDGDTTSTPKPKVDNTLNYIMIPVSFGILLIILILAICLHCCHKRKMEEIKAAERRQYSSTKQKARNSNSQSPFLASHVPVVAVKPQKRADTETHVQYEDETNSHYGEYVLQHTPSPETQSPHKRKKKKKSQRDKKRKENIEKENGHINEGGEEDLEQNHNKVIEDENSDDSDNERQPVKERRRKKKRHKRKVESPCSQEEGESDREEGGVERTVESDDISSRLPPPRKLPPLRATPDNEAVANND